MRIAQLILLAIARRRVVGGGALEGSASMDERKRAGSGAGDVDRRDNRDTNTVAVNYNILPRFSPHNGGCMALVVG